MKTIVFFLEEKSAEEMLRCFIKRNFPNIEENYNIEFKSHQGKQDLEKNLENRLKNWLTPNTKFVIMRDQDSGDCKKIKENLKNICIRANKPDAIIRIACHELETFFLGDALAIEKAFDIKNIKNKANSKTFSNPDETVTQPCEELKKITKNKYNSKIEGARLISAFLNPLKNTSKSFNVLYKSLKNIFK